MKESIFSEWQKKFDTTLETPLRFFFSGQEIPASKNLYSLQSLGFVQNSTIYLVSQPSSESTQQFLSVLSVEPDCCLGLNISFVSSSFFVCKTSHLDQLTETGGTFVQVHGTGFQNIQTLSCKFGSISVPASFHSATLITCSAPPHSPGVVAVEVSLNGNQFTNSLVFFTYIKLSRKNWKSVIPATNLPCKKSTCTVENMSLVSEACSQSNQFYKYTQQ
eukprot:Sdes_comp20866_c0_seq2m17764